MTTSSPSAPSATREQRFISFLESLNPEGTHNANRKAFAELRHSLSLDLGTYTPVFAYVEPFLGTTSTEHMRKMFYLVAGLYAIHPAHNTSKFGEALAQLQAQRDSTSLEYRFLALLNTNDEEQLAYQLRQMITLLRQSEISFDYAALLKGLCAWWHPDKYVQQDWAQVYYRDLSSQAESSHSLQDAARSQEHFITFLEGLNPKAEPHANRKALAQLRQSLSFRLGSYIPAFAYVERYLGTYKQKESKRVRRMHYLVTGLYAMHPLHNNATFSEALTTLRAEIIAESSHKDRDKASRSLESRFLALLATDEDEQLAYRLRQMVNLLKKFDIGLNYAALLKDLRAWQHVDKYVQRRWAQRYYRYTPPTASTFSPSDDAPQAPKGH